MSDLIEEQMAKIKNENMKLVVDNDNLLKQNREMRNRIEFLECQKTELEQKNKILAKIKNTKREYAVVRSIARDEQTGLKALKEKFDEGYEIVRASEYVPENEKIYGYIEYILTREVEVEE